MSSKTVVTLEKGKQGGTVAVIRTINERPSRPSKYLHPDDLPCYDSDTTPSPATVGNPDEEHDKPVKIKPQPWFLDLMR